MALRKEFSMQKRTEKKAYEMCNTRNTKIIEKINMKSPDCTIENFFQLKKSPS